MKDFTKVYNDNGEEFSSVLEDDEYHYCVASYQDLHKIKKSTAYYTKEESMYQKFLKSDSPVGNFKSSKYYSYYLERAHREDQDRLV